MSASEARDAAVFQDCTGRWLSINKMTSLMHSCNNKITSGPKGPKAEKVQKAKLAVALNADLFDEFFAVDDLDELIQKVIKPHAGYWGAETIALEDLVPNYSERRDIIPPRDWTPDEEIVMAVCAQLPPPDFSQRRKIVLGDADDAEGWTDGTSYIAIARNFLKGMNVASPATWTAIGLLLCHEYAHADASTSATHVHSPEFYETYHDGSDKAVPRWVRVALKEVRPILAKMTKKAKKNALRWLDNIAAAENWRGHFEGQLLAAKAKQAAKPQEAKAKPQPKPQTEAKNSYASILGARGYERRESPKGTQVWEHPSGARCQIDTRHGAWRLTEGKDEWRGHMTPTLAETFDKLDGGK